MSKILRIVLGVLLIAAVLSIPLTFFLGTTSAEVLPILETFTSSTAPDWVMGGTPGAYLTAGIDDPAEDGWLRLTGITSNEAGYAYYNKSFPSDQGILVIFDYVSWGGSGADGLGFFLFDGETDPFRIGDAGGSLGYANGCDDTGPTYGLSNGYVGIGIDEWGNFADPTDRCHHGGPGITPDSVTIRYQRLFVVGLNRHHS